MIQTRAEVEQFIGTALTELKDVQLEATNDLGEFRFSIETIDSFAVLKRNFINNDVPMTIPFTCTGNGIHMLFARKGHSVFNTRKSPFVLKPGTHAINYFNTFECNNILEKKAKQDDITFRLSSDFYEDILISCLPQIGDTLPDLILRQREFNTINEHLPTDPGIEGLLDNILDCPYKGEMRNVFIRENLRVLMITQLLHFQEVVRPGKIYPSERKISARDEAILTEIKDCIDRNFLDPCSLEQLSKKFGINEFKIKHGFRALFHASPIRYLQQKRLEFSLTLLRDTDKTIKQIADEIGYSHASNFTLAFTRSFGKPPQYFRSARAIHEPYQ